ncbi:hypothetical protein EJ05DRAFT_500040 [Pseudovirgaria hyperparasitica]|uniref:Uncharacterized protein n=1 Tax=Pseudovirgaria hyperparasitica TaxID=470096 RepID=A0A6A6W9A5_9PEZI|nr:uncharacterized protein EJ05DRAFT_500040 [Pseudovirgaria hyperparasitica]KAF2758520.1 hypothetical protein EJ05DRAFT_500040 [Pseudovirgaria hyperparasitica]
MALSTHSCRCIYQSSSLAALSTPMLFLSMILPRSSYAQLISSNTVATTPRSSISFTSSTLSTTTASSTLSEIVQTPRPSPSAQPNAIGSTGSYNEDPVDKQHQSILNYYFVFLVLLAIIVAVGVYILTKRRRRQKLENRNTSTSVLARDLNGWSNSRRWINGTRAMRTGNAGRTSREDGLNEHGEAPPPYVPKVEIPPGSEGNSFAMPLRTLTGEGRTVARPPDYAEALRTPNESIIDPSRPNTAATHGGESSRSILGSG